MWFSHTPILCSFYTILESNNKKLILKYFTIDYIVTFPCLLTKMSKLAAQDKFLDLSDYGRPLATLFAQKLKHSFTPIHVTLLWSFWRNSYLLYITKPVLLSWFFIILKSIIDGDGELAE
jgi:hypothetical protein